MPALYLTTPGARARLVGQHLEITLPKDFDDETTDADSDIPRPNLRRIPLHELEHVVVNTRTGLSLAAMATLAKRGVPVVLTDDLGRTAALCQAPAHDLPCRLNQYQSRQDSRLVLDLARTLVEAKIANSRRLLQRLAANRKLPSLPAVARLNGLRSAALRADTVEACRGFEGAAAGDYFSALATYFPDNVPFERRSRRPPHNAANALLSFGYTLLTQETITAAHAAGLDPALGYLHEAEPHRPALALDLIEPFRAPVVDGLTLDLLNHGTLHPERHFDPREGGIYLNLEGRRRFFTAWERRLDRPFTSDLSGERTTLRNEMHRQLHSLKRTLRREETLSAFIMN